MYLSFYHLKEEPFRLTPDLRFLYLAETHRAALSTMVLGVMSRKGFIVATGPVGTGKTTLLHAMLQILSEKNVVSAFLFNPTLTRDEFLEALIEELEIRCESSSKTRRLLAVQEMLMQTQEKGGTVALVIDEAQLLSVELLEEIRLLSNTETYREKLIQVVLCGQTELLTLLERPESRALRQRVASRCQLRPLSLAESRAYIAERLHAAGLSSRSPFTGPAIEEVYRHAGGVPRLINLVCDSSLSIGFDTQSRQIGPDIVRDAAERLGLARVEVRPIKPVEAVGDGNGLAKRLQQDQAQGSQHEINSAKSTLEILREAMRESRPTAPGEP